MSKLDKWKARLEEARLKYGEVLAGMDVNDKYYNGTRDITKDGKVAGRKASNVRNIVYELVESEVDTTIPLPRVEAVHEEDVELAKNIEDMLRTVVQRQRFSSMNDLQERTVPIQGGTFWHVEWDPHGGGHCVLGDAGVSDRHPKTVIPQPGVYDMRDMEYFFLCLPQPKEYLERRYGVKLKAETEENPEVRGSENTEAVSGVVTQNIAYFRNERGGVGMYSWVGEQELADYEDYLARRLERCKKCGAVRIAKTCVCGSHSFSESQEEYEEITEPITLRDGTVIEPSVIDEEVQMLPDGRPMLDEDGAPVIMPVIKASKIPYYKPDMYPVILRRNVSKFGSFLGSSDVEVIADQQEAVKKYGSKIEEKILKGGSYATLPEGVRVDTTDEELKVIRLRNPSEKAMIGVINVQPDVSKEMTALDQQYAYAKSTLGITDAFQGKYDASATSGAAKQFSANQSAGRMQSKREMKNNAYAELYKMIFQFMLAYSDQRIPTVYQDANGDRKFSHFDRWDFLRMDAAGEFYWNDEFIFTIDPSATLSSNRDAIWTQMDLKFQNGAFGPLNEKETLLRYWTQLANMSFPFAEQIKQSVAESLRAEREALYAMSAMQNGAAGEGLQNAGYAGLSGVPGAGTGMP